MKIVIIAWRHWVAGRRYRSLALNAKRLGHEVVGFASFHLSDTEITIPAFQELGVPAYPKDEFHSRIDAINPDVIFGAWNHPTVELEMWAQEWATKHNKVRIFINHHLFQPIVFSDYQPEWASAHYLVTNQMQVNAALKANWPANRVHLLGCPDLDFITEEIDTAAVRERLGCAPGQKLIGVFPDHGTNINLMTVLQLAKKYNWRVALHMHPQERRRPSWDNFDGGFYYTPSRQGCWQESYNLGAFFVASFIPGNIGGIQFYQCQSFELMKTADCLLSDNGDVFLEAYALGKSCHKLKKMKSRALPLDLLDPFPDELSLEQKILHIFEKDSNDIEQDPILVEKWFWKLDGLWWQRALNLVEKLIQK